jgi:phage shock protein C
MQNVQPSLLAREDTFFGVCQGLGEDLGIHSNILRLGFGLALFFNPAATLVAYAAAGVVVALSRLIFPSPRPAAAFVAQPEIVEALAEAQPMPLAA